MKFFNFKGVGASVDNNNNILLWTGSVTGLGNLNIFHHVFQE